MGFANFNMVIEEGEIIAVLGHNGSGKSTIAKLANGLLLPPQHGEVLIDSQEINLTNVWEIRRNIGMVFQNPENQFVGITVRDDVAFGLENRGVPRLEMLERITNSLKSVGLEGYLEYEPHNLSGGQKQRVAIASVMAMKPEILLLDEATSMLDPKGRKEILSIISQLRKQVNFTMLMITHDLSEIYLADRILVMNEGQLFMDTTKKNLFSHPEELEAIGLTLPFTVELAKELEQYGFQFSLYPLNDEEFIRELWTSNLDM
ncbi:ATPase component of general energizing module of ECF transporters [Gracilibacillus boraciitolerans JCM 21714]|uniref:ATPase component of general energizing module of ECF transporters n=1 Tax=Gracilibacillus boraciitolerans JCM 21714 TaxID=1298598 RepID=W4VLL7_9BACI|nr:ATPase component of general energizing module of ECF transporters [Gracilibacillus boraciitolerans JCM 21714]